MEVKNHMKRSVIIAVTTIIIIAVVVGTVIYVMMPPGASTGKFRAIPLSWITSMEQNLTTPWTPHGPEGETLRSAADLQLTDSQKATIRDMTLGEYYFMGATLDTTELLNKIGMNKVLNDVGKANITFMGAGSISEQIDQLNSLAAKAGKVSFIVAEAYESVTTGPAFSALSTAGVPQVHNWATPVGLYNTTNYIGLVDADGYGQGAASAEILAYAMNYKGKVGMIYFSLTQWTNVMRYAGANDTFAKYPGIEVVARSGFTDPGQGYDIALGMLQAHPDLDAIWATWMAGPGTGAAEAVIALGRQDSVVVAAPDLGGVEGARDIADPNNPIIGCGEADCIEMGKNSINAAFKWLLGGQERASVSEGYFVSHVYPIVRSNLLDMWSKSGNKELFGDLPADIVSLAQQQSTKK
jgi:ribose transport system substrate-binding protein